MDWLFSACGEKGEKERGKLTCHTDGEVVSKHLSDVSNKVSAVGETIGAWLPLLSVWWVCAKEKEKIDRKYKVI